MVSHVAVEDSKKINKQNPTKIYILLKSDFFKAMSPNPHQNKIHLFLHLETEIKTHKLPFY